jgi:RNA polymerase sigma-70 factor (ECF subfamily)
MPDLDPLQALERVVREHRLDLVRLARSEGLGAEDAVDCVHDGFCTFLQIGLQRELPPDPAAYRPLLAGIVRNAARNKLRRHHLSQPHEPVERAALGTGELPSDVLLAHAEDCIRLRACVDQLCEKQRTVVLMRLLEERPGEDVAESLGLTRGYVDVLLHRAKAALLVCMTGR